MHKRDDTDADRYARLKGILEFLDTQHLTGRRRRRRAREDLRRSLEDLREVLQEEGILDG